MKKILVSMFLLVFGLCLVGCVHSTYGYQFHFYVDGGNGTIKIDTSSSFNPDVKLCKNVEYMCTLDCVEESYFIELNGGEKGSREITFIATPNTGYQVKEWLFNGEIVEGNKTNSYTAIVTSEEDYVGVIAVRFEEIICVHKWDEGKHQQVSGGGHDELVYTCEYCGYHKYVDFIYEMQMEKLATIVENEFKTLNTEKIIIKDLIKMLEDILVKYNLTDTQIKEIEVCVSVLEVLDEFDEITKEELEELYKNPDISDNIE